MFGIIPSLPEFCVRSKSDAKLLKHPLIAFRRYNPTVNKVHIDQPLSGRFVNPNPSLVGWFATDAPLDVHSVKMWGQQGQIAFRCIERRDVEAAYPGLNVFGFSCLLSGGELINGKPGVRLELGGEVLAKLDLSITPEAAGLASSLRKARFMKRQWCLDHARCPCCKSPKLSVSNVSIKCPRCKTVFEQRGEALNFLSPELYRSASLEETLNVSMNAYDYTGWQLIHRATASGGKVLDCGAGLRVLPSETVVNLEIVDLPSTDVLGVGQSLPFRDGCFDAVLSFAVLEHVTDPFACAREMVRVVKPGGQIYCHVPFLQPEHGYPNHFYNMTRSGLTNLFPDLLELEHVVPDSGLPIVALHWMVSSYASQLDSGAREKFLGMTMAELIDRASDGWHEESIVRGMNQKGRWELACTTALLMEKAK
jgi:SAM-dependent methyltransferase